MRFENKLLVRLVLFNGQDSCVLCPHNSLIVLEHASVASSISNINGHIINVLRLFCCFIPIAARIEDQLLIARFKLYVTFLVGPIGVDSILPRSFLLHVLLDLL